MLQQITEAKKISCLLVSCAVADRATVRESYDDAVCLLLSFSHIIKRAASFSDIRCRRGKQVGSAAVVAAKKCKKRDGKKRWQVVRLDDDRMNMESGQGIVCSSLTQQFISYHPDTEDTESLAFVFSFFFASCFLSLSLLSTAVHVLACVSLPLASCSCHA